MDYNEFRRHLGKAGLTINEFAGYLDVQPSSVSNHGKKPAVPVAYAVLAVLLGDAADRGIDFKAVLARFGVHSNAFPKNVRSLDAARSERTNALKAKGN